jgi:hypothetical protein
MNRAARFGHVMVDDDRIEGGTLGFARRSNAVTPQSTYDHRRLRLELQQRRCGP